MAESEPAAEQVLGQWLPLPYRVGTLLVLGIWLWGSNLKVLHAYGIDAPALIRHPSSSTAHISTYRLALVLTVPLVLSLLVFAIYPTQVLPILYLVYAAVALIVPSTYLSRRGRHRFWATLRRISIGGIATDQDGRFGDVLMADVLTSYAKPIADLYVMICLLVSRQSTLGHPDRRIGGSFAVPLIIAAPFLIRFRQCITEALRARAQGKPGFQHLANALKYATAFPGIIISAMKNVNHPSQMWVAERGLSRLWLLAIFTNSFYSFYWDVAKDWDLTLFNPAKERNATDQPWALRRQRIFRPDMLYYAAMCVDLLLRCTWSLKLSVHLYHLNDLEGGIFLIELMEIFRRWMWVFLRVETEWIRQRGSSGPGLGLLDEVPLVEAHAKIDDD